MIDVQQTVRPLLIGGAWRTTEAMIEARSPVTGALLELVSSGGAAEIDAAVRAAQAAYPAWRDLGERGRMRMMHQLHDVLAARMDDLTALIHRETGKPPVEALSSDVLVALETLAHHARHGTAELAPERIKPTQRTLLGHRVQVVYEPVGVVGVIGPWNVPLGIGLTQIASALIVGNTVVFKPSEFTSLIGLALAEACVAAGFPPGVLNVITGGGAAGAALAAHPGTRRIMFTGSVATGRKVAVECARRLCPCVLELGGVGAAIVRADADPEVAARGVVFARFVNNGQICAAAERVYVNQQIARPFIEAVVRETLKLRSGGDGDDYDVGPLINAPSVERMEQQVADAQAAGATVRAGGTRPQLNDARREGHYFAPTVLTNVTPDMAIMREETFGPLLPIMEVADDDEALQHANSLPLGLGTTIWTRDVDAGAALGRKIETGMVWINDSTVYYSDPGIPWGGVKESGIGRSHGRWGLQAVADLKVVARSRHSARLWWFPYASYKHRLIKLAISLQHRPGWRAKLRALAEALLVR